MKHFSTFVSMFLLLLMGGVQTATAQDDSDWERYAQDPDEVVTTSSGNPKYVYLYNVTKKQFLNAGGEYGMQGILNPRGIRMTLESGWSYYYLKGPIVNSAQGSYLAMEDDISLGNVVYIDRARDNNARFTIETIRGGRNTFRIHNTRNGAYWTYDTSKHYVTVTSNGNNADVWCLISIDDYKTLTQNKAQVGNYNVSGLLYNTRFIRNVSDPQNLFWHASENLVYNKSDYCTAINPDFGTISSDDGNNDSYARTYGSYGCLEIGRATGEFYQEVDGLRPGLYKVSAQAFFDGKDSAPYDKGYIEKNTANATNAYIFANDNREPIPMLTDDEHNKFMGVVNTHYDMIDNDVCRDLFRRNVPASQFMTGDDTYNPNEERFVVEVYVLVGSDKNLRLGVGKSAEGGRVYMDNMTLTYMGNTIDDQFGFGVDAYGTYSDVDKYKYSSNGYMFYLSRKFVKGVWSSLTLPVDLSASQLYEAFGENMELVKLTGLNRQNTQQIFFEPVDLSGGDGLEAGQCYLVKVTKEPVCPEYEEFKFKRINEELGEEAYLETNVDEVSYKYGNVYQFLGVRCPSGIGNGKVSGETGDHALTWTAYYYHPNDIERPYAAPVGSYVMSGGDMYHLNSEWSNGLIGTAWYIEETNPTAGTKTLVIDNGNGTTDINGIVTETPAEKAVEGVYTINGQKIASDKSLNDLPKGIYIVNGKKHIVR